MGSAGGPPPGEAANERALASGSRRSPPVLTSGPRFAALSPPPVCLGQMPGRAGVTGPPRPCPGCPPWPRRGPDSVLPRRVCSVTARRRQTAWARPGSLAAGVSVLSPPAWGRARGPAARM